MKKLLLTLSFLSFSFSSTGNLLTPEEIEQFNTESENLKIISTFNPKTINTLVIGSGILGSERHFFGSFCQQGDFNKNYVTSNGQVIDWREQGILEKYKIPTLHFDQLNNIIHYHFENNINFNNKEEALFYQQRRIISPMEVDPQHTLFLDINSVFFDYDDGKFYDYVHLKGNAFDLNELPFSIKVDKIIIEYLGDCLYANQNFEKLDWLWLQNLHNILAPNGTIYFEMRADSLTSQDPKIEKASLSEKLFDIACDIEDLIHPPRPFKPWRKADFERHKKGQSPQYKQYFNETTDEEFQILMDYKFPTVADPVLNIKKTLHDKFEENSFACNQIKYFKKHSFHHVPDRYYDIVRIEASSKK